MGLKEQLLGLIGKLGGQYSAEDEVNKTKLRTDHSSEIIEKMNSNLPVDTWLALEIRRREALKQLRKVNDGSASRKTPNPDP